MVHHPEDGLVGKLVKVLDNITADIHPVSFPENIHKAGLSNLAPDKLGGQGEIVQQPGELTRGTWMLSFTFDDVTLKGHEL